MEQRNPLSSSAFETTTSERDMMIYPMVSAPVGVMRYASSEGWMHVFSIANIVVAHILVLVVRSF